MDRTSTGQGQTGLHGKDGDRRTRIKVSLWEGVILAIRRRRVRSLIHHEQKLTCGIAHHSHREVCVVLCVLGASWAAQWYWCAEARQRAIRVHRIWINRGWNRSARGKRR